MNTVVRFLRPTCRCTFYIVVRHYEVHAGNFDCFDAFFYSRIQCASSLNLGERKGKE